MGYKEARRNPRKQCMSQNRGTPIETLMYYNPDYRDPRKGTERFKI